MTKRLTICAFAGAMLLTAGGVDAEPGKGKGVGNALGKGGWTDYPPGFNNTGPLKEHGNFRNGWQGGSTPPGWNNGNLNRSWSGTGTPHGIEKRPTKTP